MLNQTTKVGAVYTQGVQLQKEGISGAGSQSWCSLALALCTGQQIPLTAPSERVWEDESEWREKIPGWRECGGRGGGWARVETSQLLRCIKIFPDKEQQTGFCSALLFVCFNALNGRISH